MRKLGQWWRRAAFLFADKRRAEELREEMLFHREMKARQLASEGMPETEAALAAQREFGNELLLREASRDAWGWRWLDTLRQDLRYGLRMMRVHPGFTAVAVLTLALGIGANATIFSIINAALVRPLPFRDPARLVMLDETEQQNQMVWSQGISAADYQDLRAANHTLEAFGLYTVGNFALTGMGETITLDGKPYTVIGVMPSRFEFPIQEDQVEVWTPLAFDAAALATRGAHIYHGIGRLKPGVTAQQVKAELEVVTHRLKQQYGRAALDAMNVDPMKESLVAPIRGSLLMAGGAVLCVLLIACANLAGLLLARATSRQREMSVRLALGAGRRRLVRQLLTESVMLGLLGGAVGLAISVWTSRLLLEVKPPDLPLVGDVSIDLNVLLFTLAASIVSGLVFGMAPALQVSSASVSRALNEAGTRTTATRRRSRLRRVLVAFEVGLSLVLLCGAGLMVRTLMNLRSIDPGFDSESVLTAELLLPKSRYTPSVIGAGGDEAAQREFARALMEKLRAQPQVEAAGGTTSLPMGGGGMIFLTEDPRGRRQVVYFNSVTLDYFATLHMPLLQGRNFTPADAAGAAPVTIISESAAKALFPGEDPIGKTLKSGFTKVPPTVIGVVRDVRQASLLGSVRPAMYLPFDQKPWPFLRVVIRGHGDARSLAAILREQVHAIDKNQPVDKVRTMDTVVGQTIATQRFYMLLLGTFAAVALGLALIGIYGVVSFETEQRTHEIGIRMALGARQSQIFQMIVRQGIAPAIVGLLLGTAGAFATSRLLKSLVYGVTVRDPFTFALVPVLMVAAALLATTLPARRAVKVDPMVALRYE